MTQEVEEALVGRLIVQPDLIPTLSGKLSASDFTDATLGSAYEAMERLVAKGRPVDLVTLKSEGVELDDPTRHLSSLHTAPVDSYVAIIKQESFKASVLSGLTRLRSRVNAAADATEIVNAIHRTVSEVTSKAPSAQKWTSIVDVSLADFERGGLHYGIPALDAVIQPAHRGNFITVAARPNTGKSAFALSVAEAWSRDAKQPVLFTSVEMSEEEIKKRHLKHIPAADLPLYRNLIVTDRARTTAAIREVAADLRLQFGGVAGIIVDYIQKVGDPGDIQHERVARISGIMKDMAAEFDCPVLVPSQLSRASEGGRPKLSDLAQSGAIEADSDVVLALHRNKNDPFVDLYCLKNRHGSADWQIRLDFDLDQVAVRGAA